MSDRYPGGVIRKTPPTVSQFTGGSGLFTMSQVLQYVGQNTWSGGFTETVQTFNSSTSFSIPAGVTSIEFLVVGGGGGGGIFDSGSTNNNYVQLMLAVGGGGAGGFRTGSNFPVTPGGTLNVVIGAGGARGQKGNDSYISVDVPSAGAVSILALGGGAGRYVGAPSTPAAAVGQTDIQNGASGGGGTGFNPSTTTQTGGSGVSPQGNNGGNGSAPAAPTNRITAGGGGGGASAAGLAWTAPGKTPTTPPNGGAGTASSISGSSVTYAGGGGAGGTEARPAAPATPTNEVQQAQGGAGGGGNGAIVRATGFPATFAIINSSTAGTANRGGGGGGGGAISSPSAFVFDGPAPRVALSESGGSGIAIIKYKTPT